MLKTKSQHIIFILDRSGSMSSRTSDVIGGFNTYVQEMRQEAIADGMSTLVSLVTFADNRSIVFASRPVAEVQPIGESDYKAVGNTALLDAVYFTVSQYRENLGQGVFGGQSGEEKPAVLVIIFTDGAENASRHASWQDVTGLIAECEALGNWTFTYVGAHANAWSQAGHLRMKSQNVVDAEHLSVHESTRKLIEGSKRHRASYRDMGKTSTEDFFKEDDK